MRRSNSRSPSEAAGADLPAGFARYVCQTSDFPIGLEVVSARGATLRTRDGRRYVDMLSGIAVNNVGHAHPEVVAAVRRQAGRYLHAMVYGEYVLEPQVRLAARLSEVLPPPLSVAYFTNSGAEAVEGALKLAKKATGRRRLVAFENSYHGDTHGALSVTGREVYRQPFEPLLPDVRFLPFDDPSRLAGVDRETAAVIVEPIQGEGGVRIPSPGFLPALRTRCDEVGALLIFDEVQTGLGRTGRLLACEWWNVVPDILVLAKALGGGMPLGAFIGSPELMGHLRRDPPLSHVTTFGGHPVSCAAGLAALEVILREDLATRAATAGDEIVGRLAALTRAYGGTVECRGRGLMIGWELDGALRARRFVDATLKAGAVVGWTLHSDRVVRIAPPLNISSGELARGLEAIERGLRVATDV